VRFLPVPFVVWLATSGTAPLVALHVAFEHHEHANMPAAPHDAEGPGEHHEESAHEHPQLDATLAQPSIRLAHVTATALPTSSSWNDDAVKPTSSACPPVDPPPRSAPILSRNRILLV